MRTNSVDQYLPFILGSTSKERAYVVRKSGKYKLKLIVGTDRKTDFSSVFSNVF